MRVATRYLRAQHLIVSLQSGRTVAGMENVASGLWIAGFAPISFGHICLQRLRPYGDPESLIECSVFLFRMEVPLCSIC